MCLAALLASGSKAELDCRRCSSAAFGQLSFFRSGSWKADLRTVAARLRSDCCSSVWRALGCTYSFNTGKCRGAFQLAVSFSCKRPTSRCNYSRWNALGFADGPQGGKIWQAPCCPVRQLAERFCCGCFHSSSHALVWQCFASNLCGNSWCPKWWLDLWSQGIGIISRLLEVCSFFAEPSQSVATAHLQPWPFAILSATDFRANRSPGRVSSYTALCHHWGPTVPSCQRGCGMMRYALKNWYQFISIYILH